MHPQKIYGDLSSIRQSFRGSVASLNFFVSMIFFFFFYSEKIINIKEVKLKFKIFTPLPENLPWSQLLCAHPCPHDRNFNLCSSSRSRWGCCPAKACNISYHCIVGFVYISGSRLGAHSNWLNCNAPRETLSVKCPWQQCDARGTVNSRNFESF